MSAERRLPSAEVERILRVTPDDVFDAWLEVDAVREFICPAPGRAASVAIDARVGGAFRFVMSLPDRELIVTGRYLAIDRPDRISFTWRCSDTGELDSVVTVTFAPHAGDGTLMRITHSLLPATLVDAHIDGWTLVARQVAAQLHGSGEALLEQ